MTSFSDQLSHLGGVPVMPPLHALGKSFFVKPSTGSDGHSGRSPAKALKTLSAAKAKCAYGDTIYLMAESNSASATSDYQSAAYDHDVDGVNIIGVGANPMIGSRARIAQLSTVKTIEDLFTVSANNCLIANIAVFQGVADSTATSPRAVVVTGERNHFINCQIQGGGDASMADNAGARSLAIVGGSENTFSHCYIGLDTISRGTQAAEIEFLSSATRNVFEDCIISSMAGASGFLWIKANTAAADIDRFTILNRCTFINAVQSTATTMTAGMAVHASLGGMFIIRDHAYVGATDMHAGDTAKIVMLSNTNVSTTDIEAQGRLQSVDVAA